MCIRLGTSQTLAELTLSSPDLGLMLNLAPSINISIIFITDRSSDGDTERSIDHENSTFWLTFLKKDKS